MNDIDFTQISGGILYLLEKFLTIACNRNMYILSENHLLSQKYWKTLPEIKYIMNITEKKGKEKGVMMQNVEPILKECEFTTWNRRLLRFESRREVEEKAKAHIGL